MNWYRLGMKNKLCKSVAGHTKTRKTIFANTNTEFDSAALAA